MGVDAMGNSCLQRETPPPVYLEPSAAELRKIAKDVVVAEFETYESPNSIWETLERKVCEEKVVLLVRCSWLRQQAREKNILPRRQELPQQEAFVPRRSCKQLLS